MCKETYQQLTKLAQTSLEVQLALQCAPVIFGLKYSNLLIVDCGSGKSVRRYFEHSGISQFLILETAQKSTYLLYRPEELSNYLFTAQIKTLLIQFGCYDTNLSDLLTTLKMRYKAYTKGSQPFPHEIGLVLGYPPEDVIGFIENKGNNYLHAGYWKVYENLAEKQKLFRSYEQARESIIHLLSQGVCIQEVIRNYNKDWVTTH